MMPGLTLRKKSNRFSNAEETLGKPRLLKTVLI